MRSEQEWIELLSADFGFKNIQKFKVADNKRPCSGFDYFFTADAVETGGGGDLKVFVKCGQGDSYAKKEFEIYELLNSQNSKYFPKPIAYKHFSDGGMLLATEYIAGKPLYKNSIAEYSVEQQNNMFNSLYDIANILFDNHFIHRDIHQENLIVKEDGIINLIDFQHIIGNGYLENQENIEFPKKMRGTNKRFRPHPFVWDDMVTIYKMLRWFDEFPIEGRDVKLNQLKSRFGKLRYYFLDNKFPLKAYLNFKWLIYFKIANVFYKYADGV